MKSVTSSFGLVTSLLLIAGCEVVAGLDERDFVDMSDAVGGSGPLQAGAGGSTGDGGQPSGGAGAEGIDSDGAGSGGSSPSGAGGAKGGSGGSGGKAPMEICEDVTSKLCLRPPWPAGEIPFDFAPDVVGWIRDAVSRSTYEAWEGMPAGDSALHFFRLDSKSFVQPPEGVPKLLFVMGDGCGPVSVTAEAVTVEIGSCSVDFEVPMVVGAALGLPRFHQRADRDRYLKVAPASAFPCGQGRSQEICSPFHGMPALFGTFGFDYDRSLMWPHPRVPGAPGNDSTCGLEPIGRYLFVARDASQPGEACYLMENSYRSIKGDTEISAIAELYALRHGWSPFLPVGADLGPEVPIQSSPEPGAEIQGTPLLVATENNGLAAFARAGGAQWMIENDGESWGPWEKILDETDTGWPAGQGVLRPGESSVIDFVSAEEGLISHSVYDRVLDTSISESFDAPPQPMVDFALTTDKSSLELLYVATTPESPELDRVFENEYDGASWSGWQPLPTLDELDYYEQPIEILDIAAVGSISGERHVMLTTSFGYRYTHRDADGPWEAWTSVSIPTSLRDIVLFSNEAFPLAIIGKSLAPGAYNAQMLWFSTCDDQCSSADSWSRPLALGAVHQMGEFNAVAPSAERFDIVSLRIEFLPHSGWLWSFRHKRWRPLPTSE